MKIPRKHYADITYLYPSYYNRDLKKEILLRPFKEEKGLFLLKRIKYAYLVFVGKADIIIFSEEETKEEYNRRYKSK